MKVGLASACATWRCERLASSLVTRIPASRSAAKRLTKALRWGVARFTVLNEHGVIPLTADRPRLGSRIEHRPAILDICTPKCGLGSDIQMDGQLDGLTDREAWDEEGDLGVQARWAPGSPAIGQQGVVDFEIGSSSGFGKRVSWGAPIDVDFPQQTFSGKYLHRSEGHYDSSHRRCDPKAVVADGISPAVPRATSADVTNDGTGVAARATCERRGRGRCDKSRGLGCGGRWTVMGSKQRGRTPSSAAEGSIGIRGRVLRGVTTINVVRRAGRLLGIRISPVPVDRHRRWVCNIGANLRHKERGRLAEGHGASAEASRDLQGPLI